MAEISQY